MPSIKDQSTVEALARAFASNGRKQEQAMIDIGYTPAYANSYCGKMWENKRLIAAITAVDNENKAKTEFTVHQAEKEYELVRAQAMKQGQLSAAASAITGKARLYGMDKDNQLKTDSPVDVPEEDMEQLQEQARQASLKLA